MKSLSLFTLLIMMLGLSQAQNDICRIDLESTRTASFAHGEQVNIEFDYSVDEPGGVRIFARPFSKGALSNGYGAGGSPIYTGSGTSSTFFTINGGNVLVDEIRFQVLNSDQSTLLKEFFVPVKYFFSENGVSNFSFDQDPKIASLLLGEQVTIDFDYNISESGGARIFIRPFTDGDFTPGYGATGSIAYTGTGSSSANFSINSGINVRVDSLIVRVTNSDQTAILQEFFIPVNWYWSTVKVTGFEIVGDNFPKNGDTRTVKFEYETTEADGARIFPRPMTNGGTTPNYSACPSPVFTGSGSDDCDFTISSSNQRVDQIRFMAVNPDQSQTLLELYYPTDLLFGNLLVENVQHCPPSPARLTVGERVNTYFDLDNQEGESARIFVRPFTDGGASPGYGASGSPAYGSGTGSADDFFTISSSGVIVDQMRFSLTSSDQNKSFGAYFYPVHYVFGETLTTGIDPQNDAEHISLTFGPNPFRDQGHIFINSQKSEEIAMDVLDMMGRLIYHWPNEKIIAGVEKKISLDANALRLSAGTYFIRVQGQGFVLNKIIQKVE